MIIFLLLILLSSPAFAAVETEKYLVERPDGGVSIVQYIPGSRKTVQRVLEDQGLKGFPVRVITPADLPPDRKDRDYWKWDSFSRKVVVDEAKKQNDLNAKAQAESERDAVLAKLKITKEEFQKLK